MSRILLSPMVLLTAVWLFSTGLYFLRWSVQFVYEPAEILPYVGVVLGSFGVGCLLAKAFHNMQGKKHSGGSPQVIGSETSIANCWKTTQRILYFWLVIAIGQIIAMRGFPMLWIVIGDERSYRDFGFLSINGLINSMVLACAISGVYCWLVSNNKKYLIPLGVVFVYASLIFNRQMLFTMAFEAMVLYLIQRPVGIKILARISLLLALLISLNGIIGQYRTGHEELKELFQVQYEYSEIPGSIMWMYAYVTTPLNNLINTIYSADPSWNPLFFNTISTLFPSVVRGELFADVTLLSAQLYSNAFTVSTAFVDPYLDYGPLGMAVYGVLFGFVAQLAWFYPTPRSRLMYCVLAQSVILSIFTNFLFYLPSIFQLFWLHLIGSKYQPGAVASEKTTEISPPQSNDPQSVKSSA